ncbi:3'-5' exonuclease [Oerskovia sp. KBS0722]|uniref:3'-5' exonuclease n=1 Tax=Oerskovia sp. KBS0722 TaxID=1179673 RepID=UPI00110D6EAE|nr:3'-5' exonuclease [Oerskovia sp. KBS0722]QDW61727.1 AAA family ATPase [Oerskovia sp. KBS0722]
MKILREVEASPEQMAVLLDARPGVLVVRGAAGSGKTTTALLRLRQLCATWRARRVRLGQASPVRVLVLTYNQTLQGYVQRLADEQVAAGEDLELRVQTFAKFAIDLLGAQQVIVDATRKRVLVDLGQGLGLEDRFLVEEVEYALGRFTRENLRDYVGVRRDGRGTSPRMEAMLRERLLTEVIAPYQQYKDEQGVVDWNDVALLAAGVPGQAWDVVVVDEAQDFSANQVRAVMAHLAADHSATFVMDTAQRIYPRAFTWAQAGVSGVRSTVLRSNHRNTRQVAAFARPLVEGLTLGEDGALPDLHAANRTGPEPVVVVGRYSRQLAYVMEHVVRAAIAVDESVAFLHAGGGGWFDSTKAALDREGIDYVDLTRLGSWPTGSAQVAFSTLHSAKGLEFDHVILIGLSQDVTPHGPEVGDTALENLRRLLAMGIGRARESVTLGYKPTEESTLLEYLDPDTFQKVIA